MLFPVRLSSVAGLVIYSQDLSFLSAFKGLFVLHLMILSLLVLQWLVFPTIFLFLSLDLGIFADLFQFFLFYSAVSWDCHVNYPYPLLLTHSDVWYFVCQMLVCILKSQRILTSSFCRTLSILCSHHLSAVGRLYFLQRFQCSIDATLSCRSL